MYSERFQLKSAQPSKIKVCQDWDTAAGVQTLLAEKLKGNSSTSKATCNIDQKGTSPKYYSEFTLKLL